MTVRVAINGFGRMGRLGTRAWWGRDGYEIAAMNDPAFTPEMAAHLIDFDTVHRRWDRPVGHTKSGILIDGREVLFDQPCKPGGKQLEQRRYRYRSGMQRAVQDRCRAPALLRPWHRQGDCLRPDQGRRRAEYCDGR